MTHTNEVKKTLQPTCLRCSRLVTWFIACLGLGVEAWGVELRVPASETVFARVDAVVHPLPV